MAAQSHPTGPAGEHNAKHAWTRPWQLWVGASLPWLSLVFLRHSGYGQQAAWVLGLGITVGLAVRLALQDSPAGPRRPVVYAGPLVVALAGALTYNLAPGTHGASTTPPGGAAGTADLFGGFSSRPQHAPTSPAGGLPSTPSTPAPPAVDTSTPAARLAAFRAVAGQDAALGADLPRDASDAQIATALTGAQAQACASHDVRYLYGVTEKSADVQLHCLPAQTPTSAPPTIADRDRWWQPPGGNYRVIVNVLTHFQDGSVKYRVLTTHWQGHWFLATWSDLPEKISPLQTTRPTVPVADAVGPETPADADKAFSLAIQGRTLAYIYNDVRGLDTCYADHRSPQYQADKANIEAGMPGNLAAVMDVQQSPQPDGTVAGKAVFLTDNDRSDVAATLRWLPGRQRWLVASIVSTPVS